MYLYLFMFFFFFIIPICQNNGWHICSGKIREVEGKDFPGLALLFYY